MLSSVPTCCAAYHDQRANPANFGRRDSGRNDTFPHVQRPGAQPTVILERASPCLVLDPLGGGWLEWTNARVMGLAIEKGALDWLLLWWVTLRRAFEFPNDGSDNGTGFPGGGYRLLLWSCSGATVLDFSSPDIY
jgi:hypothetical protein